jgi:hypothetical protein
MKITTLDEHGKEVNEKDYGNLAPKCYLEFNPSQPIFTIEEDELNIINSKSMSFEKAILLYQFKAAFDIDYNLFRESKYYNYWNLGRVFSDLMLDRIIKSVDKELSVLLKNYSRYDYKYKRSKLSPCASEILLSDKWLYVLLFHALNSSQRNRKAEDPHSALLTSFLNLLSRYYYALKRQLEIGNLGVRAEEQLTILRPYINLYKSLYGRPVGFYGGFFDRLLFSLHASNYKNKCVHFNLINLIEQLAGATTNGMCHFKITDSRKTHTPNEYVFSLSDYAHNERFIITLNDLEIASLRNPTSEVFAEVSKLLSEIFDEHEEYNRNKFKKEVQSDYEDFCIKNECTDWLKYKSFCRERICNSASNKKVTDPNECYYKMLFPYYSSTDMVSISDKDIIASLFTTLKANNDTDQYSLYKGIICLNYVKQQILNEEHGKKEAPISNEEQEKKEDPISKAVHNALEYIKPIYYDRIFVNSKYHDKIQDIIDDFFNMQETKENIIEPHSRGFNLKLVYNFIGVLKFYKILNKKYGSMKINFVLSGKDSPQRQYIDKWKTVTILKDAYLKAVEALVDKYR